MPLRTINNQNWIEVSNTYRRCFILEKQFRQFYVDYLLREIGDQKTFFTECRCRKPGINDSFMDYVIRFQGKYLPVEVKLSVNAEPNLIGQVSKYIYNSTVFLTDDGTRCVTGEAFHDGRVLIIDTEKIFMFDATIGKINEIMSLDSINSKEDLKQVRQLIGASLI